MIDDSLRAKLNGIRARDARFLIRKI